ncbi:BA14K family protein [Aminobacter sp. Piv2-1]|uniref:BA14K family protein n=1 Tax=Aminobacter sp. Piv2-1 TaxID=3031122 RepID=UPI0030AFE1B2
MTYGLSTFARGGLVALGIVAGIPLSASAAPVALAQMPVPAATQPAYDIVPINHRDGDYRRWRHFRRYDNDDRWRYRRNYRRHSGVGIFLNFGIPAYRYYDPYYDPGYYRPRYVAPRPLYRMGPLSSAHVRWCYNRYRSYRAWDNTFQPYVGPRQQCWSPYS